MAGIWKETSPTLPAGGPMTPFCSEISQGRSWQMFQAEKTRQRSGEMAQQIKHLLGGRDWGSPEQGVSKISKTPGTARDPDSVNTTERHQGRHEL